MSTKQKAELACFYVSKDIYYRMLSCNEDEFYCYDEDSTEEYNIKYEDVEEDDYFMELSKI